MNLPFCDGLRRSCPTCAPLLLALARSRFVYPEALRDRIQCVAFAHARTKPWSPVLGGLVGLPCCIPAIAWRVETVMGAYYSQRPQ